MSVVYYIKITFQRSHTAKMEPQPEQPVKQQPKGIPLTPTPPVPSSNALFRNQSSIVELTDHPNPNQHMLLVKIYLPRDIIEFMSTLSKYRRERLTVIQKKQKDNPQEWVRLKEKFQSFKKLQDKMKDQQKKKNSDLYQIFNEIDNYLMKRQKYNFGMFQSFYNRGKCPHIKFSYKRSKENCLQIRLNKAYVLNELKLTRSAILTLPASFAQLWVSDFYTMIKLFAQLSFDNDRTAYYSMFIKSIDVISITFDIIYADKKIYRFRYSPFEFRSNLFIKQHYRLTGYGQQISLVTDISTPKTPIVDQEFYNAPRCFIFQDLTDSNMGQKIMQRTNIFYLAYSISKGVSNMSTSLDGDQYCKKCQWYLYFSTTRLKKFIFTWPFRPFRKNKLQNDQAITDIQLPSKEIMFSVPFYLQLRQGKQGSKEEPCYRLRAQYQEQTKELPPHVRDEIICRTKEWFIHYREYMNSRQARHFDYQKFAIYQKRLRDNERKYDKPEKEQSQLQMFLGNRDRFDRLLVGFLVIVSTVIDRNLFLMADDKCFKDMDDIKIVKLETPELTYKSNYHTIHFHWLEIQLQHRILPYLFNNSTSSGSSNYRSEMRLKCGQWRFIKVNKWRREWNIKLKKGSWEAKGIQVLSFPDKFKEYIDILLRHFPLRGVYKDIIGFIASIGKLCFNGWEQTSAVDINSKHELIFRPIVSALLSLYYYDLLLPFKERQQKERQRERQKVYGSLYQHQKLSEQQKAKRDDKIQDQFKKVIILKILTKGDSGFMSDDNNKLLAEVTFRIMQFKSCWLTRIRQGFIVLRIFQGRIDFQKEYVLVERLPFGIKNKVIHLEQSAIKEILQKISVETRHPLVL